MNIDVDYWTRWECLKSFQHTYQCLIENIVLNIQQTIHIQMIISVAWNFTSIVESYVYLKNITITFILLVGLEATFVQHQPLHFELDLDSSSHGF